MVLLASLMLFPRHFFSVGFYLFLFPSKEAHTWHIRSINPAIANNPMLWFVVSF